MYAIRSYYVTAGVPAFLSPGDKLMFPVNLTNTTTNPVQVKLDITTKGCVRLLTGSGSLITLQPNIRQQVMASLAATDEMGDASVVVKATGSGVVYEETFTLAVRPAAGPVRQSGSGVLEGGNTTLIKTTQSMLAGSVTSQMWITRNPIGEFAVITSYSIHYTKLYDTNGLPDDYLKAEALYRYLQERMRYVSIQYGVGGFQPFSAKDVDKWNYGDCKARNNFV